MDGLGVILAVTIFVLGFMACKSKKTSKKDDKFHSNATVAIDYLNDLEKHVKKRK